MLSSSVDQVMLRRLIVSGWENQYGAPSALSESPAWSSALKRCLFKLMFLQKNIFFPNVAQGDVHLISNTNCVTASLPCNSATSVLEPGQGGAYFQI